MPAILFRPIITEKSMLEAKNNWFTFEVSKDSRKPQIAKAIEEQFKVHVVAVRTLRLKHKVKRTGRRRLLRSSGDFWKKTLVCLKAGEKIDLFEVVQEPAK